MLLLLLGCSGSPVHSAPPTGPPPPAGALAPGSVAWTGGAWTAPLLSPSAGAVLTATQRLRIEGMDAPLTGAWRVYTTHHAEARARLLARPVSPAVEAANDVQELLAAERGLRDVGIAPFLRLLRLVEGGGRAALSGAALRATVPGFTTASAERVRFAERSLSSVTTDAGVPPGRALATLIDEDQRRLEVTAEALRAWRIAVSSLDLTREQAPAARLTVAYDTLSAALDADLAVRLDLATRLLSPVPPPRRATLLGQPAFLAWAGLEGPGASP